MFGGEGTVVFGGGGAALGGAIFSHGGKVLVRNSTFTGNRVVRGLGGGRLRGESGAADNGTGVGGAIFSLNSHLTILFTTISGNVASTLGGGVVALETPLEETVAGPTFTLHNTIIAGNGADECFVTGAISTDFQGNLIQSDDGCGGVVSTDDPQLEALQINSPGNTPTMAISTASPAFDAGIDTGDPALTPLTDQRGVDRPQSDGFDIGAYEKCVAPRPDVPVECDELVIKPPPIQVTLSIDVSGSGSTSPPPGDHDVAIDRVSVLMAFPDSGHKFVAWTGDFVTAPTKASTTIFMDDDKMVTANFTPMTAAEWGEQLEDVIEDILEDPNTPRSQPDKIGDALAHLRAALAKLAATPPDRHGALGELKFAVSDLEAAVRAGLLSATAGAYLMNELAGIARLAAQDAIQAAKTRGGKPAMIAQAEEAVAQGDVLRASGDYGNAIVKYRFAALKADGA